MTREQIEQEASKHYLKGSASHVAFCSGAEWALNNKKDGRREKDMEKRGKI